MRHTGKQKETPVRSVVVFVRAMEVMKVVFVVVTMGTMVRP